MNKIKLNYKTLIVTICMIVFFSVNLGYSQSFEWAKDINSYGAVAIDDDGAGNSYVTGEFQGTITIGTFPINESNGKMYIAKYDKDGQVLWVHQEHASVSDIGCDVSGNFYVMGLFSGSVTLGSTPTLSGGGVYVAKYDNLGNCLWSKAGQGTAFTHDEQSLVVDNSGNCYVAGSFANTISFGSTSITQVSSSGSYDVYLAKYSSGGNCLWAVSGGASTQPDQFRGVAVDPSGSFVYLTGNLSATAQFGGRTLIYNVTGWINSNWFYVKYNSSSGAAELAVQGDVTNPKESFGVGVDNSLNVYILGDNFISKYNDNGNYETGSSWSGTFSYNGYTKIVTDVSGNCYVHSYFLTVANFPPYSVASSGGYENTNIFVAKFNSDCNIQWVVSAGGSLSSTDISADESGNAYITGSYTGSSTFGSTVLNSGGSASYVSKISPQANLITGNIFIDNNGGVCNGSLDPNEPAFPNMVVFVSGNSFVASGQSGQYSAFTGGGTHTLSIPNLPLYYTVTPATITVPFPQTPLGQLSVNNNFALCPDPNKNDLRIEITEIMRPRPGFKTAHRITYKNVGTTTLGGTITLTFDNHLLNPVCTPLASNISGNVITWVLPNPLHPNDEGSIDIIYEVPNDVNLVNTILISDATITSGQTDETPNNNTDDVGQLVVASCDPNDKSVEPAGDLSPQNVLDGDYLTYTIRFQNTGTYYAETVIITDEISDKLDLNFIETLSYSHDYTFSMTGNKVIWTFNDILLPEAASNEAKSHGFVKFRIKLKNNLSIGDEITNSANIYFDFNDPVITNTTTTKIVAPAFKSIDLKYRLETEYPVLDTIRVYLAESTSPYQIIDSSTVFPEAANLKYSALPSFTKAVSGVPYYIIVKHRNSIETWSTPVTFTSDLISYDFTTSINKAFGRNMKLVSAAPVIYGFYGGDVNQDGTIDLNDMTGIDNDSYNFRTGYVNTDVNGDGYVDLHDMTIVDNNSYHFVSVIRP